MKHLLLVLAGWTASLTAAPVENREPIQRYEQKTNAFKDRILTLEMAIQRKGKPTERQLFTSRVLNHDGKYRSLLVFSEPKTLAGVAFLSHNDKDKKERSWIYFPEGSRRKRIHSSDQTSSFLGSHYSYEDMSLKRKEQFQFFDSAENICGKPCTVVRREGQAEDSGYRYALLGFDKSTDLLLTILFFDKASKAVKRLNFSDYRAVGQDRWLAHAQSMEDLATGESTQIIVKDVKDDTGFNPGIFSENSFAG